MTKADLSMQRPSEEEVMSTAERTKAALEKLTNGKIKAAQPSRVRLLLTLEPSCSVSFS